MGRRKRGIRNKGRVNRKIDPTRIKVADISCGFGWNFMILDELNVNYSIEYVQHDNKNMMKMFRKKYGKRRVLDLSKDTRNLPRVDIMFYSLDSKGVKVESDRRKELLWLFEKEKPHILVMEESGAKVSAPNGESKALNSFKEELLELGYTNNVITLSGSEIGFPNETSRVYIISCLNGEEYKHTVEKNTVELQSLLDEIDISEHLIDMFQRKTIKRVSEDGIYGYIDDGKVYKLPIYYSDYKIMTVPVSNSSKTPLIILDKRMNTIRRLSGKELFRVMGYSDSVYYDFLNFSTDREIVRIINQLSIYPVKRNVVKNVLEIVDSKKEVWYNTL